MIAVFAAALAWRAVVCLALVPSWEQRGNLAPAPDAYPLLAQSLLDHGVLGFGDAGANPTTARGPAFPLWLALGILAGSDAPSWLGLWASLPALLVGVWVGRLCWTTFGPAAGAAAWVIALAHPLPAFFSGRVMSDEFAGALGFAGLAAWAAARKCSAPKAKFGWGAGAGVLLGAHILARSAGILTLVALLVVEAHSWWARRRAKTSPGGDTRVLAVIVVIALAPALAWSVRSSRLEGRVVFVQSLTGYNFWVGEAFERFGFEERKGDEQAERVRFVFRAADAAPPGDPARSFWWGQLTPNELHDLEPRWIRAAVAHVVAAPASFAIRWARGLAHFWLRGETRARTVTYALAVAPVLIVTLVGCVRIWRGDGGGPLGRAVLVSVALQMAAYAAIVPMARYSAAVYPALAYLGGAGGAGLVDRVRRRPRRDRA